VPERIIKSTEEIRLITETRSVNGKMIGKNDVVKMK